MTQQELKEYRKHTFRNLYDLRSGMICELRDGSFVIVIDINEYDDIDLKLFDLSTGYPVANAEEYQDNLLIKTQYNKKCDIMKVWYDINDWLGHDVMWERGDK